MIRTRVRMTGVASGPPEVVLDMPPEATIQELLDVLRTRHPQLRSVLKLGSAHLMIAVDHRQVSDPKERLAKEGEGAAEVNILMVTPIIGGCGSAAPFRG